VNETPGTPPDSCDAPRRRRAQPPASLCEPLRDNDRAVADTGAIPRGAVPSCSLTGRAGPERKPLPRRAGCAGAMADGRGPHASGRCLGGGLERPGGRPPVHAGISARRRRDVADPAPSSGASTRFDRRAGQTMPGRQGPPRRGPRPECGAHATAGRRCGSCRHPRRVKERLLRWQRCMLAGISPARRVPATGILAFHVKPSARRLTAPGLLARVCVPPSCRVSYSGFSPRFT